MGSFKPNGFGLFDMAGNVSEWVADCYAYGYAAAPKDGSADLSSGGCQQHAVRGGSWRDDPKELQVSARQWFYPLNGFAYMGFRVARNVD